jgi:hypothetical protein
MTPRALLTSIGATAIGFALIVGTLATSGLDTTSTAAALATGDHESVQTSADWSGGEAQSVEGSQLATWNDPCVVAL